MYIDVSDHDNPEALDNDMRSLSLHQLDSQENSYVTDEEDDESSTDDGRFTNC